MTAHFGIGSCYHVRQAPGAERLGGLKIRIRPKIGDLGSVKVERSDVFSKEEIEDDLSLYIEAAMEGIRDFASRRDIDITDYDLTLSEFLYHPSDASPLVYRRMACFAFRTALEGLMLFREIN